MDFDLRAHTIFEVVHGSRAYGLDNEHSDIDVRGIAIPPAQYFLGFAKTFEQARSDDKASKIDSTIFDIRKFFRLAAQCNPNIIDLLWVPERCYRVITPAARQLIADRHLFLSKRISRTFSHCALEALKDIRAHREKRSPNRNPARTALEVRYGYDTKDAMHLVRYLRMCREALTTGALVVERPDREELLAVLHGAWTYEKLVEWATEQNQELTELARHCTILPESPDFRKLDDLCISIVNDFLKLGIPR